MRSPPMVSSPSHSISMTCSQWCDATCHNRAFYVVLGFSCHSPHANTQKAKAAHTGQPSLRGYGKCAALAGAMHRHDDILVVAAFVAYRLDDARLLRRIELQRHTGRRK